MEGKRGGFREGSGRPSKFTQGKTKVVRIPEGVDVEELIALADDLKTLVESWKAEAAEPLHQKSPRYDRFMKAIDEVQRLIE